MKLAEITNKNEQELVKLITDLRTQLAQAYVDLKTKEVKNVKQIAQIKRNLAQTLTIAREREIAREEQS